MWLTQKNRLHMCSMPYVSSNYDFFTIYYIHPFVWNIKVTTF